MAFMDSVEKVQCSITPEAAALLCDPDFHVLYIDFEKYYAYEVSHFIIWLSYLDMVTTLLRVICANRKGD